MPLKPAELYSFKKEDEDVIDRTQYWTLDSHGLENDLGVTADSSTNCQSDALPTRVNAIPLLALCIALKILKNEQKKGFRKEL